MAPLRSPTLIVLTSAERAALESIARATTAPHARVQRALIVLRFAAGASISEIARSLELQRNVVRKWVRRFAAQRLAGLEDLPRSGRPRATPKAPASARPRSASHAK